MLRFEPNRLIEYTDSALIEEIARVAKIVGTPTLTVKDFDKHARVGRTTLSRRFGGWRLALEAANLAHLYNERCHPLKSAKQPSIQLTSAQMIAAVQEVASRLGKTQLTKKEFDDNASINGDAIRRRFGKWKAVLKAAGLSEVAHGRRYTDDECFENLLVVWTHYGRPPMFREMGLAPSVVGGKAYVKRWLTWTKAIHAFAQRVDNDLRQSDSIGAETPLSHEEDGLREKGSKIPEADRHEIRLGLRYAVLRRDRFRCVLCGRSPATDLSCNLHVDHAVAHSKGGKTVFDNLRSTCSDCNLGKSDRE